MSWFESNPLTRHSHLDPFFFLILLKCHRIDLYRFHHLLKTFSRSQPDDVIFCHCQEVVLFTWIFREDQEGVRVNAVSCFAVCRKSLVIRKPNSDHVNLGLRHFFRLIVCGCYCCFTHRGLPSIFGILCSFMFPCDF